MDSLQDSLMEYVVECLADVQQCHIDNMVVVSGILKRGDEVCSGICCALMASNPVCCFGKYLALSVVQLRSSGVAVSRTFPGAEVRGTGL